MNTAHITIVISGKDGPITVTRQVPLTATELHDNMENARRAADQAVCEAFHQIEAGDKFS